MFWILAALLSLAVIALFAWPLLRPHRGVAAGDADLSVYRDQLSELARDEGRGLVPAAEAATAKLEIQRRLLAAASESGPALTPARGMPWPLVLLLLLLPVAAAAIYLDIGNPGLPGLPLASRPPEQPADQQLAKIIDLLQAKLKSDPTDPKGWTLLGDVEAKLGRYQESADAYAQAIARRQTKGEALTADLQSLYGEALSAAAGGQVTPKAKTAFAAALALDPKEPRARYYLALSDAQAGNLDMALKQWVALETESPADAPWRPALASQIDATAKQLGRDPATLPGRAPPPPTTSPPAAAPTAGSGPTDQDIANAANMTPEQRAAFIDSMVSGLAGRLKNQPGDVDGWMKLANAYEQLGRHEDARGAWKEAATRAPERLDAQLAYASALAPLAEQAPLPGDFAAVVDRIRKLSPGNGLGLYCAGLIARANGDRAGAKALWLQVVPLTPEGSPQRKELQAKIAALGV
jgi:cytochrome c-type biogenesis protein CcmH